MKKVLQKSEQRLKDYWGKTKKYYSHYRYVCSFLFAVVLLIAAIFVFYIDIKEITFVNFISGVIAVIGLVLFFRRVKHQETQVSQQREQINIQIKQRVDERFTTAVNLLGSSETSARTGAIYSLFHLALDEEKYRKEIAQILCSHVRSKTEEKERYQKDHKDRPSNEIQTTIDLLFKENGLYHKFNKELAQADLSYAFLVKANFQDAECQGADFSHAECLGAIFSDAKCQGADFKYIKCQGAHFFDAKCKGADFAHAECQGANFDYAKCQGANFFDAKCQEVSFLETQCQKAIFSGANCQGAIFSDTKCQGANFSYAKCQGVNFGHAKCQGADFSGAKCQGAYFNNADCQGVNFGHAKCQGANFHHAKCQGAHFKNTECQGAYTYAEDITISLVERIAKDTALDNVVFAGALDDSVIKSIESAKDYLGDKWYQEMQKIIKENADKVISNTLPEGIITGVLEDSAEIRAIIAKDWERLEQIQKEGQKK